MGFFSMFSSPQTYGTIFGSPFSQAYGSLFGDRGIMTNPSGAWDYFKNGETNTVNKGIADENLKFQRENLDYQKALQQKIFDREDSAYQRTVSDMRAAGLSPLAMNGTNGAGEAIQTEALHNDYQHQDVGVGNMLNLLGTIANQKSMYDNSKADESVKSATAESIRIQNAYDMATLQDRLNNSYIDSFIKKLDLSDKRSEYEYNMKNGFFRNMSTDERKAYVASRMLGLIGSQSLKEGTQDLFSQLGDKNIKGIDYSHTTLPFNAYDSYSSSLEDLLTSSSSALKKAFNSFFGDDNKGKGKGKSSYMDYLDWFYGNTQH